MSVYEKQVWVDGVTPADAEHFNHMEEGIAANAARGEELSKEIAKLNITEPMEDDIPKIFFGASLPQTKTEAVMDFRYISKTLDFAGYCETKAQGNSSMAYPKKNQTVKMYMDEACSEKAKIDFKNWGKQNKHCYKANWTDLSHARNVVSARIWGDIVRSRVDFDSLPEEMRTSPNCGAIDGFPVKVYAGGVYQGRYTLNIPKDAWMANMDDENPNHCILCGENYVSGCFRAEAVIDGSDWSDEVHDEVPESIKTRWNEIIGFVMNSTDAEFKSNLVNYFDVTSLIDYHLYGLLNCGWDAFGKNQLYITYDGLKWFATVYDMDYTWGLKYDGAGFYAPTEKTRAEYEDFKNGGGNLLYIRLEDNFAEEITSRWDELKAGALSIPNIINRFERFTDIASPELVAEDYATTTANGAFTGILSKDTNNIQQIREYAAGRYEYVESYVNPSGNLLENLEVYAGYINSNTGEVVKGAGEATRVSPTYIPITAGASYTLNVEGVTDNTGGYLYEDAAFYDANKTFISPKISSPTTSISPLTFTAPANAVFVRVGFSVEVMGGETANWDNAVYTLYEN